MFLNETINPLAGKWFICGAFIIMSLKRSGKNQFVWLLIRLVHPTGSKCRAPIIAHPCGDGDSPKGR